MTTSDSKLHAEAAAQTPATSSDAGHATRGDQANANLVAPEIAPSDPIISYLQSASGAVDLSHLDLDSPALRELRASGVTLVVPLVTNGELVGLLNLGRRLSDQDYSADDRRLLESLASRAAPAMRVGQLVREHQAEIQQRGRMEQELEVAQLIQKNFLPRAVPEMPGWRVAAEYRPARAVGGDFYDFIELPAGRIGLLIGDVTDKGIPAAMVMAATKSLLRASAERHVNPGDVLAHVNDQLCPEIPENMFVTCFYGVLDPPTGELRYANAGHNLPLVQSGTDASELRATGMPLGLMPEMDYAEQITTLSPGTRVLLYSDGLIEAHDAVREMFGIIRAAEVIRDRTTVADVVRGLLQAVDEFASATVEQEDDITLVALEREPAGGWISTRDGTKQAGHRILADFTVASAPGNERDAMRRVAKALVPVALAPERLERLKTATAEATMNAMEHGNKNDPKLDVRIIVAASNSDVTVRISDKGATGKIIAAQTPDIDAKLAGRQSPRGWGLFLITEMVDSVRQSTDNGGQVIELVMYTEGAARATSRP